MYVCGITPYSPSHLGHARCYIAFDLVHRWLEASGWTVNYVQNFTDIDDKIINAAAEEGIDFLEVANRNIEDYYQAMDSLNVLRADHYPRVTEVVPEIIEMVQQLIDKEHAYVAEDGVWFSIASAPEKYGMLTGQSIDAVLAGAGAVWKNQANVITRISLCGRSPNPVNLRGLHLGGMADPVGTSNVVRCRSSTLESSSTFTVVDTIYDSHIMKLKSSNLNVVRAKHRWFSIGCTMDLSTSMEKR